jgi:hypothetical protein
MVRRSQIVGFVRAHLLRSLPTDSLDGKYVLLFAVVPAIMRAATSDNTGAADSPYNLILETKSRKSRARSKRCARRARMTREAPVESTCQSRLSFSLS